MIMPNETGPGQRAIVIAMLVWAIGRGASKQTRQRWRPFERARAVIERICDVPPHESG